MNGFFDIFNDKYNNNVKVVNDIYQDKDMASYYNANSIIIDDLYFYLNNLKSADKVLEIGTGNGRIFTPLFNHGIDMYGIEPAKEMIEHIRPKELSNRVFNISLQDFISKESKIYNKVIIPATSISVFSPQEINLFISKYLDEMPFNQFELLFDFLDINFFKATDSKIYRSKLGEYRVYSANYLKEDKVYFNIYLNNGIEEKIGKSVKYIYTEDIIKNMLLKKNYNIEVTHSNNTTRMIISIKK